MPSRWQLVPHRAAIPAEVLAGMVVALGIIPEAIAFSIVAGVDPQVGLFGSICILIVVSLLGGRPGMVSACTAGVVLLMGGLMQSHGLSHLLAASILAGVFQIIWGYLRLAQQMRFVPRAVTVGFVNAIGVLIFMAQLPQLGLGRDGNEVIPSLAANVVEDLLDQEADYEAEARAEGLANITAGLFGGMAGAGMIGQSVINLESGGATACPPSRPGWGC